MDRERLKDLAFIALIVAILVLVSVSLWQRSASCSERGGEFVMIGPKSIHCRLPSGDELPM